ncbi:MAG: hypothetical protein ACK4NA_12820 [Alphaproteobacteria bacterium]
MNREYEYWQIEPVLAGETVFLLAGGPSLDQATVDKLRGRRAITINSSCHKALAAGLDDGPLFFTDNNWFEDHEAIVRAWRGPVVTLSRKAKRELPDLVKRVEGEHRPDFTRGGRTLRQGRSSGQTAISLAIAMGARRLVLLGYDMRPVGGRTHHHDDYKTGGDPEIYAREFLPAFAGWNAAAHAAGVRVLNATPGSALTEFPFADSAALLAADERRAA